MFGRIIQKKPSKKVSGRTKWVAELGTGFYQKGPKRAEFCYTFVAFFFFMNELKTVVFTVFDSEIIQSLV
jgi:hypothetical protein